MTEAYEVRLQDIRARVDAILREADSLVGELRAEDAFLVPVSEQLVRLGSMIIPAVRQILRDPSVSSEVRGFAAIAGFSVGDREESLQVLLDEVQEDTDLGPPAARVLANAGQRQAAALIESAISRKELSQRADVDAVVAYLRALHKLGYTLSGEIRSRLASSGIWEIEAEMNEGS